MPQILYNVLFYEAFNFLFHFLSITRINKLKHDLLAFLLIFNIFFTQVLTILTHLITLTLIMLSCLYPINILKQRENIIPCCFHLMIIIGAQLKDYMWTVKLQIKKIIILKDPIQFDNSAFFEVLSHLFYKIKNIQIHISLTIKLTA